MTQKIRYFNINKIWCKIFILILIYNIWVLKSKTNGKSPEINKANKEEKEENSPKWVTENNNKEKLNEIKLVFNIKDDIQKRKEENKNIPTLKSNYKIKIFMLLIKKKTLDINIHKVSFKDDKKRKKWIQ